MNPDLVLPIVASLGCLILCVAAFSSYRLKWSQAVKMALVWLAVFLGLFLVVEWFMMTRDAVSSFV